MSNRRTRAIGMEHTLSVACVTFLFPGVSGKGGNLVRLTIILADPPFLCVVLPIPPGALEVCNPQGLLSSSQYLSWTVPSPRAGKPLSVLQRAACGVQEAQDVIALPGSRTLSPGISQF